MPRRWPSLRTELRFSTRGLRGTRGQRGMIFVHGDCAGKSDLPVHRNRNDELAERRRGRAGKTPWQMSTGRCKGNAQTMIYDRSNAWSGRIGPALRRVRRMAAALAVALLFSLAVAPAYAHGDDEAPPPPTPEAQAAAARGTIAVLSLVTGIAVYYVMQRKRLTDSGQHPAEWDRSMNRNSILFAVIAAVAVGGVTAALSKPPAKRVSRAPMMPPDGQVFKANPGHGFDPKKDTPTFTR